jgi:hypothetical protein
MSVPSLKVQQSATKPNYVVGCRYIDQRRIACELRRAVIETEGYNRHPLRQGVEEQVFASAVQTRKNDHRARIANPELPVIDVGEGCYAVNPKCLDPFRQLAPLLRATDDRQPVTQPTRESEGADDPDKLADVTTIAERNEEAFHAGKTMSRGVAAVCHPSLFVKSDLAAIAR